MESTTGIQRYSDSPPQSRSTSPTPSHHRGARKPRALQQQQDARPPAYTDDEPYRDDPSSPMVVTPQTHRISLPSPYQQYTDASAPPTPNDDDVPLAHLLHTTPPQDLSAQEFYPLDAPPSYSVAVRQSYQQTLVHHIPRGQDDVESRVGLVLGFAVEDDMDGERPDDVRHDVEKVVAMFTVAILLLMVSAMLGWLALGSGVFA
ncbi:hypothetical protein NX059_010117 [Plenodomus lindquistii]|nr:hypothetical protein NX059_010117 [Plenodomus lindquistii]